MDFVYTLTCIFLPCYFPNKGIRDNTGTLIGWSAVRRDWTPGILHVEPSHRRRGFGRTLYNHVTNAVLEEGILPVSRVEPTNEASIEFHKKCGYDTSGASVNYLIRST